MRATCISVCQCAEHVMHLMCSVSMPLLSGHTRSGPQDSSSPPISAHPAVQQSCKAGLRADCDHLLKFCSHRSHAAVGSAAGWPQLLLNHKLSQGCFTLAEAHHPLVASSEAKHEHGGLVAMVQISLIPNCFVLPISYRRKSTATVCTTYHITRICNVSFC